MHEIYLKNKLSVRQYKQVNKEIKQPIFMINLSQKNQENDVVRTVGIFPPHHFPHKLESIT